MCTSDLSAQKLARLAQKVVRPRMSILIVVKCCHLGLNTQFANTHLTEKELYCLLYLLVSMQSIGRRPYLGPAHRSSFRDW